MVAWETPKVVGDLAEGVAGLAEFVGVEDSSAALWGGGHCG